MNFQKRAKIVVTLGPSVDSEDKVKELILSGANVVRFNTSHGDIEYHREKIRLVKKIANELNSFVATLIDLQGPKIRFGKFEFEIPLKKDEIIILEHYEGAPKEGIIPVDYKGLADDVQKGDVILADDGKIRFEVIKVSDNKVWAKVLVPNVLKQRKGINIPGATASLNAVTERDEKFIQLAVDEEADFIALSFVRKKEDILYAKKVMEKAGGDIPFVAKLEKPEAIENLEEIIEVSDAVMVARGDLGIELSPVEVPVCQKKIIEVSNKYKKPVIVATQMLESMITNSIPTRAEASDVANAILDGADAVMLSAETSVGNYPLDAVKLMREIIIATETSGFYRYDNEIPPSCDKSLKTRHAIVYGADKMISYIGAKAIVAFSHFGNSVKIMSKIKPKVPIVMITDLEETARRMALNWGVFPFCKNWDEVITKDILLKFDNFLINEINLKEGDYVIITGSQPKLITGRTNFVRVHKIGT